MNSKFENKTQINKYINGKIYKITSKYTIKIYIGSTCSSLRERLIKHLKGYRAFQQDKDNYVSSYDIIDTGNIEKDDYIQIIELEAYPCNSNYQLRCKEDEYIEKYRDICVNKNRAVNGRIIQDDLGFYIGKIYAIVANHTSKVYIGSTIQELSRRFSNHKKCFKKWKIYEKGRKLSSFFMFETGNDNKLYDINKESDLNKENDIIDNYIEDAVNDDEDDFVDDSIDEFDINDGNFEEYVKDVKIVLIEELYCMTRGELLLAEQFYIDNTDCVNKVNAIADPDYQKKYYEMNKERKRIYGIIYRSIPENKDRIKINGRRYYLENKEKIDAYKREYNIINEDKVKARKRELYYQNHSKNLEKNRINNKIYYADPNNKEKIDERHKKRAEEITCECSLTINGRMSEHIKTKIHLILMNPNLSKEEKSEIREKYIKSKNKEKEKCDCGGEYNNNSTAQKRHLKTILHLKYLLKQIEEKKKTNKDNSELIEKLIEEEIKIKELLEKETNKETVYCEYCKMDIVRFYLHKKSDIHYKNIFNASLTEMLSIFANKEKKTMKIKIKKNKK